VPGQLSDSTQMPVLHKAPTVSRNTMKPSILTILLITSISSFCQKTIVKDSSSISIDSIYRKLSPTLTMVRQYYPDVLPPSSVFKTVVMKYTGDSIIFLFSDTSKTLLFKTIDKYDKSGCRWWQTIEIFSLTGQLYYREGWKWSCGNSSDKKMDPDIKYFDALLYEKERFSYDDNGRVKSRKWWYAPIGLREYNYTYKNDIQEAEVIIRESTQFWE